MACFYLYRLVAERGAMSPHNKNLPKLKVFVFQVAEKLPRILESEKEMEYKGRIEGFKSSQMCTLACGRYL